MIRDNINLSEKAYSLREEMLEMCINAGDGHVTSSLSCTEILTILYYGGYLRHKPENPEWEDRDRFILSKGHACLGYYSILAEKGFFSKKELQLFEKSFLKKSRLFAQVV